MQVAIFDFDGTLYKKETFSLLMKHLKEHSIYGSRYKSFYRSILAPYIGYKMKLYPAKKMRMQLMQRYLRSFSGLSVTELDTYFTEIADEMQDDFNEEVVTRLHDHAQNGLYTMIVSGAFTPLLQATALNYPVNKIIGTEIPFHNNVLDENNTIDHVHAERKTELIHKTLQNKQVDWKNSYAYGDSYSDLSVLKMVGNPVAVCPDDKLRQIAIKKKWLVIK